MKILGQETLNIPEFENRKREHIHQALSAENQAEAQYSLENIQLLHAALPELDFNQIEITSHFAGHLLQTPFFISGMTAGHPDAEKLNERMAQAAETRGWIMGVGSQRRELSDPHANTAWKNLRKSAPHAVLLGNLGLSQVIQTPISAIQALVDNLQAAAMVVHTNPLQECLQEEGTPFFSHGLAALENLAKALSVPVILKETGCGFSAETLARVDQTPVYAVDISGCGGTHWGRIEGKRSTHPETTTIAETFKNWGISTVESLWNAQTVQPRYEVWASGGLRSGLDAAKVFALGAKRAGFAKPILEAALAGEEALHALMARFERELRIALFCTGSQTLEAIVGKI